MSTHAQRQAALNKARGNPSQQEYAEAVRDNALKAQEAMEGQTFTHTVKDITITCSGIPDKFRIQTPFGFQFNRDLEKCIQELLQKTSEAAIETAIAVNYAGGELQEVVRLEQ